MQFPVAYGSQAYTIANAYFLIYVNIILPHAAWSHSNTFFPRMLKAYMPPYLNCEGNIYRSVL